MKNIIIIFLSFFLAAPVQAQFQERALVAASGFQGQAADFFFEYSLGEISIGSFVSHNLYLLVGFQQPPQQWTSSIPQNENKIFVNVYPNPTRSFVYFKVSENDRVKVSCLSLIDMWGRSVLHYFGNELSSNPFQISIKNLHPGIYFLRVDFKDGTWQVIKISIVK